MVKTEYSKRFLNKLASAVIRLAIKESTYDDRRLNDGYKISEFRQKAKMARSFIASDMLDYWANLGNVSPEAIRKHVFDSNVMSGNTKTDIGQYSLIKEWLVSDLSFSLFAKEKGVSKSSIYRVFKDAGVSSPLKLKIMYSNRIRCQLPTD